MATTIQISDNVKAMLDRMKVMSRESYNDIIEVILEDNFELNESTKKDLARARKDIKEGKVHSQEEVERMFGL